MTKLVVIGGGKMGEALVGGLVRAGWASADDLVVVEPDPMRRAALAMAIDGLGVADAVPTTSATADVLVAVKPDHVETVCATIAAGDRRVLSIAAGTPTAALESWLPDGARVVRAMPNTPALIGAGMAAICAGARATDDDLDWAREIMGAVGRVAVVDEPAMDAVTGLSGSGPAYVFLVAEALVAAGVAAGLEPELADALTRQTLLGAARLLDQSGEDPAVLRANVTSPGGTTAAGLAVLEERQVRAAFAATVAAATRRSRELGA